MILEELGTVEIVSIAREAGDRTKIAVKSNDSDIDPVGTLVGPKGARVQNIVNELGGENIDVVKYEDNPSDFIANALNPAEVIAVQFSGDEDDKNALVIVPDYQLSLAIGKRGQNVRLAARLTGYKIDIKPESQVEFVDSEGDDVEADQETTNDNVSNEETPESIAEQIEDYPSDTFPNGEDVNSALNDDADKDEE